MKTIITTESCSDIPVSMLEKLNVPMVPFSVNFPDRTVLDGELPIQEIYDFYEATRQIPKTCAVSPYQYSEFFNRLLEDPEVEIVHIGYSSACSCSFQNALISLQDCDEKRIHLVDCLNVSGGFGLLTLKAVEDVYKRQGSGGSSMGVRVPSRAPDRNKEAAVQKEFLSAAAF